MARKVTAKNWTAYEAAKIILDGKDFEAIVDIFKRFPVFGMVCTKMNEAGLDILKALGDFTARKMNAYLRDASGLSEDDDSDDDAEDEADDKPAKKSSKKVDEDDDEDEDEDDEEKPMKKGKNGAKKSSKKPSDEDDDDDFDFDDD